MARQRLLQEGRVQAALQHPNVLPVHGVLDVDGAPGLLMPLVEGPTLAALLRGYRPSQREALGLLRAVCAGVSAAHTMGLVHRDLKPSNVLLDLSSGAVVPRVSDFGLVKVVGAVGMSNDGAVGTPSYMSPEQLRQSREVDARADLWSLGVMLYELLTGRLPFPADSLPALIEAHRRPLDTGELSDDAAALLRALLAPEPGARLASAEALSARLGEISPDAAGALDGNSALSRAARALRPRVRAEEAPARHNLPAQRDAFLGREAALADLTQRFEAGARLVTVTGTGGAGKTRLVTEYGTARVGDWPGGVWFCDLTAARTEADILFAVAAALGVELSQGAGRLDYAIEARGRALFIVDNFEQVARFAAPTVGRWLDAAPEVTFLITSRQPLELRGEELAPLSALAPADAAALLSDRAAAAGGVAFGEDAEARRAIAAMLDCLPLAIELVAAKARGLTPDGLLALLSGADGLLLAAGAQHLPPRQRTLYAALQWSWDLLPPQQRSALSQCSVFSGGFTLEAAEAVLQLPDADHIDGGYWLEDLLVELLDQNLLRAEEVGGEARFRMLVSVRWFADQQLTAEQRAAARRRHGSHFARLGSDASMRRLGNHGGEALHSELLLELDNLNEAARHAIALADGALAAPLVRAASEAYFFKGPLSEGLALLQRLRESLPLAGRNHVALLHMEAVFLQLVRRTEEASALLDRAYAAAADLGDGLLIQSLLNTRGTFALERDELTEARAAIDEALALCRRVGGRAQEGVALMNRGNVLRMEGRHSEAITTLEQARVLLSERGDAPKLVSVLSSTGLSLRSLGRHSEALACFQETRAAHMKSGSLLNEGIALGNLAMVYRLMGRLDESRATNERALLRLRAAGYRQGEGYILADLGTLCLHRGQLEAANRYYGAAITAHHQVGNSRSEAIVLGNRGYLCVHLGQLAEARRYYERALDLYRHLSAPHLEGYTLGNIGDLDRWGGRPDAALRSYRRALEQSGSNVTFAAHITATEALLHAQQGRADDALARADAARELSARVEEPRMLGSVLTTIGRARLLLGQRAAAARCFEAGEGSLRQVGAQYELADVLSAKGALALGAGDADGARALRDEALAFLDAGGISRASPVGVVISALSAEVERTDAR